MAKIGSQWINIGGKSQQLPIYYNDKLFEIFIPEEWYMPNLSEHQHNGYRPKRSHTNWISAATEQQVKDAMIEYAKAYEVAVTQSRKVLMIQFDYNSNRWQKHYSDEDNLIKVAEREDIFQGEAQLEIKCRIATERKIKEQFVYVDTETDHVITSADWEIKNWTIIDYTDEREAFLRKVYESLFDLIDAMKSAFHDEDSVQQAINSRTILALNTGKQKPKPKPKPKPNDSDKTQ